MKRDLTGLSKRLAGLSPEKRQKLEELLRGDRGTGLAMARREDPFAPQPLSFAQQRLWFLNEIEPDGYAYNIPAGFYIDGALNVDALERAVNEIVRRHETLRTRFDVIDGQPMQAVAPFASRPLLRLDLTAVPANERQRELERVALAEATRPFDLLAGSPVRFALATLGPERHALLFVFHHIVYDVWSVGVLVRELVALYEAFANGRPSPLAELPVQYADYARWQRERLAGEALDRHIAYWREQLSDAAELEFPTDRPRGVVQTSRGGRADRVVSRETADRLAALSRREGVTPFMTLLAALQALMHRRTCQDDIVIGAPTASRHPSEVEGLIGFFVNSLVMRTSVAGDPTFRELIGRVRTMALDAYAHQDAPFDKVVEALRPERTLSRNPFFQVIFTYQSAPPLGLEGLRVTPFTVETDTATVDVEVYAYDEPDGLRIIARYNADLYDDTTIAGLLRQFERILDGAAADPDRRVSRLELIGPEERRDLLAGWSRTAADYPADSCIQEIFDAQAHRTPDATAVVCADAQLTYRELDERAQRLAHVLRRHGVGRDVLVGLCLDRSVDLIVALVAIVKAGGAYLPLDPAYPPDRLAFMLRDARPAVLVTQRALRGHLPPHEIVTIDLDDDLSADGDGSRDGADVVAPDSLAYVTYTSGSTGVPKGVEVRQRGVLRLLFGAGYAEFGPEERWLQLAPVAFDASTLEIWGALLHGGTLVVYPERIPTARGLADVIRRQHVTSLWLTASLFNAVIDEAPDSLRGVKQLLIGGEALSVPHVRRAQRALPGTQIINGYGPTEGTTFTCCHPIPPLADDVTAAIPIGRPIANTSVYVVDAAGQLAGVGVPGELYIGGDGLARGYLNRPALTAEKFVPDAFGDRQGGRLYRTGDRVRWRADGTLDFLGRLDQQVKIRGFRIEPGEVEAAVAEHPGVREACVIVRELERLGRSLVAYIVLDEGEPATIDAIRDYVKSRLPEYMVPAAWVMLPAMPLTGNGKVDRAALPAPETSSPGAGPSIPPQTPLERQIADIWSAVLGLPAISVEANFFDLGGHSLLLVQVHRRLRALGHDVSMVTLFTYPTVRRLAAHLGGTAASESAPAASTSDRGPGDTDNAIAIIGMAGRFPGAGNIEAFWENLRNGRSAIRSFTDEEHDEAALPDEIRRSPEYVNANGTLDDVAGFDAGLFGYTPREAQLLDPQHRIFLECAWEALERAGYAGPTPLRIGLYAGVGASGYSALVARARGLVDSVGTLQAFISNEKDFLTTRASYKLNLTGPSVTVQTACSTSLVAVHLACRSLLDRECDVALAGGVKISVPQTGYLYQAGSILSPDGHCRAFDAQAAGTVGGSGAGIVVLKRLSDALAAGDPIAAVIRGSAVNNDGALKIGYTAPAVHGQAAVIAAAQAAAKVDPDSIGYIEAHGTGTPLGDPIEIAALTQAFRAGTARTGFCPIGSVKTNVGHLDAAAGVTGLIKTVLALEYDEIPASLDFSSPNPAIDFAGTPFFVAGSPLPWPRGGAPRRAGVSAFGIGGTNAHVVVEEAPKIEPSGPSRPEQVLVMSARTPTALEKITDDLADHLERHPDGPLADVAYTLQVGRRRLQHRRLLVCTDPTDAAQALRSREPARLVTVASEAEDAGAVFLFPGQGAQYVDMGRGLYEQEPVFRDEIDRCAETLRSHLGFDLRTVLYPAGDRDSAERQLAETAITQPALFAIEYALAQLWQSWGVRPAAMLGHSIGEYVAACLAGVFTLDDALTIVAARGRLIQEQPRGAMLAIALSADAVAPRLAPSVALAAVNAPDAVVVAGPDQEIADLQRVLGDRDVFCRVLATSHAFHSPMMDGALDSLRAAVAGVARRAPAIPFVSNVTGTWIRDDQAIDPDYWASHLRSAVQFSRGVETVIGDPTRVLLEVGPGRALIGLATRGRGAAAARPSVASMRARDDRRSDGAVIVGAAGQLWAHGVAIDWERSVAGERRHRVLLPTYPFEHQRYWVDAATAPLAVPVASPHVEDWLYQESWKRVAATSAASAAPAPGLLLDDGGEIGAAVHAALARAGHSVVTVTAASAFARTSSNSFAVDPCNPRDFTTLIDALASENRLPSRAVSLWSVGTAGEDATSFDERTSRGYYGLLFLTQALGEHGAIDNLRITVVTSDVQEVTGSESLCPANATAIGLARTIPLEYPGMSCQAVDVTLGDGPARIAGAIADEALSSESDSIVAWRGRFRWIQTLEPLRLPLDPAGRLRDGGVYLITGGLGGVGLEIARYLARTCAARLVLVGRRAVPPRAEWRDIARDGAGDRRTRRTVRALLDIEAAGGELLVCHGDVSDRDRMASIVVEATRRFGPINGVVHAAGVPGGAVLQKQTREAAEQVFAAKIRGTRVLESIFADAPLDFVVLCSSLVSFTPLPGRAEYMAANLFVDAAARRWAAGAAYHVAAINWDSWREVGMAVDTARERFGAGDDPSIEGMRSADGVEAFARVLSGNVPQVIVSMAGAPMDRQGAPQSQAAAGAAADVRSSALHARPALKTAYVAPRNHAERSLAGIWSELLGIERVGIEDNFFDLGGDSVVSIQIISRANRAGIRLTPKQVFEHQTIAELAAVAAAGPATRPEMVTGSAPLTAIQRWFFEQEFPAPNHFNQAVLLEVRRPLNASTVRAALDAVLAHHDALRFRFRQDDGSWRQSVDPTSASMPFELVDLSALGRDGQARAITERSAALQTQLDLADGPIVRTAYFDLGPTIPDRLLLVVHHLVIDAVSWRFLLEDVATALEQAARRQPITLAPRTGSFAHWAVRMDQIAQSAEVVAELPYWLGMADRQAARLPVDFVRGPNDTLSARSVTVAFTPEETQALLTEASSAYHTQANDLLLAAFATTLARWTGDRSPLLTLEGHGRHAIADDLDVSRTVGWFTTMYPLRLELPASSDWAPVITSIKEQLRAVPQHGMGYGLLRHVHRNPEVADRFRRIPSPEALWLYLGQFDAGTDPSALVSVAGEPLGPDRDPSGARTHLIEVTSMIAGGRLQTTFTYSVNRHRRATIDGLATQYKESVLAAIAHCRSVDAATFTPSDFPQAGLSQTELDALFSRLAES